MKEALFVLAVIAAILAYTAFRRRKTIAAVFQIFKMLRSPGNLQKSSGTGLGTTSNIQGGKLVQCESCGVRIPENRALLSNHGQTYCSRDCATVPAMRK